MNKVRPSNNPLYRRPSKPVRPKLSFDGTNLQVTQFTATPTTDTGENLGWGRLKIDCSSANSVSESMNAVTRLYDEYRFQHCTVYYEPSTGPADTEARARIHIGYIDNPEKFLDFTALTLANRLSALRGLKNARTFNAWEKFTYSVPLTYKRKWFDVNNATAETVDVLDRSVQGYLLFVVEAAAVNAVSHGVWRVQSTITLHGLDRNLAT